MFTSPWRRPVLGTTAPTLTLSWRTVEIKWCMATSTPTIPSGSPGQEMTWQRGQRHEVVNSMKLAVANLDMPTRLPSHGQPSSPDITLLSEYLLPDVTWSTLTTLGYDQPPHNHPPLQSRHALTADKSTWTT